MAKYHISKSGKVVVCRAKTRPCPLGGGHFPSKQEGEAYVETKFKLMDEYETHIKFRTEYKTVNAVKRGEFVDKETAQAILDGKRTLDLYYDFESNEWTKERQAIHEEILSELHKKYKNVPSNKKTIFSAGLPGAGKTTVLTQHENLDMKEWAVVSSDDFKEILAKKGHVPEIEGLTPMESSTLVHQESSYLADRFLRELGQQGKNIIYDFTCKSAKTAKGRIGILTQHGYETQDMQFVFVDISPEVAKERAKFRYSSGLNEGLKVEQFNQFLPEEERTIPIGGRYLPEAVIDDCAPRGTEFSSKNAESLIELHEFSDLGLPTPKVYDNSGSGPVQIDYDNFAKKDRLPKLT